MQATRLIRWAAVSVLAALALVVGACGESSTDKAGGADEGEPRVLTMANPNHGAPPPQLSSWAEEVGRLSGGALAIEFKEAWRIGQPRYEAGTLEDVRAGKVDMAWVGARVFDTVGVKSFQALVAPLLIDSYDLEAKVFEQGIPERMLAGVGDLDVVGIGVLPGPMRKLLGVSKPFLRPGDFAGEVVGVQASAVAATTLRALGATPRAVPSAAKLDGLDAYEQQLSAIESNSYDRHAKYTTVNMNLWPRPLVIVMDKEAFEALTDEQQSILRDAAAAAIPGAVAASRAEDDEAAGALCRRGMTLAVASANELAQLRSALEPVYEELTADPETKSDIDTITSLKAEMAASAEAPACAAGSDTGPSSSAAAIPNGTYETTVTREDWLRNGVEDEDFKAGVFTMILDSGELTLLEPETRDVGFAATYTVFRDQIEATGPDTVNARWSFDGKRLRFTDIEAGVPYVVVWGSHPWVRVK